MSGSDERRREPRYEKELLLELTDGIVAKTVNISSRGLYCTVKKPIPAFSKIHVSFELPCADGDHRFECEGVVVRVDQDPDNKGEFYNVAIYFLNLDKDKAMAVEQYLSADAE